MILDVDWSRIVFAAAMTDDGYVSFKGPRHQAMVHIAMHDVLVAVYPAQRATLDADSRVRAGIHFRFATEQGKALGRQVGTYMVRHHLQGR